MAERRPSQALPDDAARMTTLRPAVDRLRDQRRRTIIGWTVIAIGVAIGLTVFCLLVSRFGW